MLCNIGDNNHSNVRTTIDHLCDDILLEVFSYLNAKELKSATLVTKRWNELIGSSVSTMTKFRFRIDNDRCSERNHQNFVIETTDTTDWTEYPHWVSSARTFHIEGSCLFYTINSDELFTFLSRLTELEELSFENVRLIHGTNGIVHQTEMPKLRSLEIVGADFTILRHIGANQLQQMQCIRDDDLWTLPEDFESIAHSIVRFSSMRSLTLWNCMEAFEHVDAQQVKCQLSSFEAYHSNITPTDVTLFEENLKQFLLLQVDNLLDLTFDCSLLNMDHRLEEAVLRMCFNKFTKLTSLDICDLSIPQEGSFYHSLSPDNSIRMLKVQSYNGEVNDDLLQKCPKLTRLEYELCRLDGDSIKSIATFCPKLSHLLVNELIVRIRFDRPILFEHLKCLNVYHVENFDSLLALMAMCPNLEQVQIVRCESAESFPLDKITGFPSMRRLKIANKCYDILENRRCDTIGIPFHQLPTP